MNRKHIALTATIAIGLAGSMAIAAIHLLDRDGQFNVGQFSMMSLVMISPLVGVLLAATFWRNHAWMSWLGVAVAAGCAGIVFWANLADYLDWSRTPPGRDVMRFGSFFAMLAGWGLCLAYGLIGLIDWSIRRNQQRAVA